MPPSLNDASLVRESFLAPVPAGIPSRVSISAALIALSTCAPLARAHPAISASAILRIESNRRVTMLLSFDALAFVLDETPRSVSDNEMYKLLDGSETELTKRLAKSPAPFAGLFEVLADGRPEACT